MPASKITIAGQSYAFPSKVIDDQHTINMYPTNTSLTKEAEVCLRPTPGLSLLTTIDNAKEVRALINFRDTYYYAIIDTNMYLITFTQTGSLLEAALTWVGVLNAITPGNGVVPGRITWAVNPTQIMISDQYYGYIYTPSTNIFGVIVAGGFTVPQTCCFYDSYFIYNQPSTFDMYSSAVNDGTTWNSLDVGTKEGVADYIQAIATNLGDLWVMGKHSTEAWWDSANATGFPLTKRYGTPVIQGCAAAFSVCNINNNLVWLDDRLFVVTNSGYTLNPLTTEAIANEFSTYTTCSDAYAFTYTDQGHQFYVLNFPAADKTWVYDFNTNLWHQRESYAANIPEGQSQPYYISTINGGGHFGRHLANCHMAYGNYHIVGDYQSGNIYLMSTQYQDEEGQFIRRKRVANFISADYSNINIGNLEIKCAVGQGTTTGQGLNPQIGLRFSNDRGYTWSNQMLMPLGAMGEYSTRVRWNSLGTAREWLFEFEMSDPVDFELLEAWINVS